MQIPHEDLDESVRRAGSVIAQLRKARRLTLNNNGTSVLLYDTLYLNPPGCASKTTPFPMVWVIIAHVEVNVEKRIGRRNFLGKAAAVAALPLVAHEGIADSPQPSPKRISVEEHWTN